MLAQQQTEKILELQITEWVPSLKKAINENIKFRFQTD